jgi:hypothetical protein
MLPLGEALADALGGAYPGARGIEVSGWFGVGVAWLWAWHWVPPWRGWRRCSRGGVGS